MFTNRQAVVCAVVLVLGGTASAQRKLPPQPLRSPPTVVQAPVPVMAPMPRFSFFNASMLPPPMHFEFRAVPFERSEETGTRKLNELAAEGWEYVGLLPGDLVAFRRQAPLARPATVQPGKWVVQFKADTPETFDERTRIGEVFFEENQLKFRNAGGSVATVSVVRVGDYVRVEVLGGNGDWETGAKATVSQDGKRIVWDSVNGTDRGVWTWKE